MEREDHSMEAVPIVAKKCLTFLWKYGWFERKKKKNGESQKIITTTIPSILGSHSEGIFRESGINVKIQEYKQQFDEGMPDFSALFDFAQGSNRQT